LLTPFVLRRMPTDIFPAIDIPVVSSVWLDSGLSAQEMEQRSLHLHERQIEPWQTVVCPWAFVVPRAAANRL